jgi:excisionase family DNA binding protein
MLIKTSHLTKVNNMKIQKEEYVSIPQLAKILGVSRITIYNKVKNGEIEAIRIGKIYAIPKKYVSEILGKTLNAKTKKLIDEAVNRTVKEYGEVLIKLGNE